MNKKERGGLMKILYINTAPTPRIHGTDAVENEIRTLQEAYKGKYINLYPFRRPFSRFPLFFLGLQSISQLKKLDNSVDLHHIFSPVLYSYPFLKFLRRPIVYSVGAGIYARTQAQKWHNIQIVVGSQRDLNVAKSIGIRSVSMIHTGIDVSRFKKTLLPLTDECILLSASSPWTKEQFNEKGLNLLFRVAARMENIRLVILWRGLLDDILMDRIEEMKISDRVRVINEYTDIDTIFSKVHGGIILASNPHVVRSFPHSMIEALAAGKPVIISNTIPMADYIRRFGCGSLVKNHSLESLEFSIKEFIHKYPEISRNAMEIGGRDFTKEKMIEAYNDVYRRVLSQK
jgi:glycosyltransferase involved in cell wall biosynthesis